MTEVWSFQDVPLPGGHVVRRRPATVEDDLGRARESVRLRCVACRRTQHVALPEGCTWVGAEALSFAAALLLHTCACGGGQVFLSDDD